MKITETVTRECCQVKDLKPIEGSPLWSGNSPRFKFCQHCGKHHEAKSDRDPTGELTWEYVPMLRPWEAWKEKK
jgi:hypothetical protein